MKRFREELEKIVTGELDYANKKFPPFTSGHEAFSVILEEVEEACEEGDVISNLINDYWNKVKKDNPDKEHCLNAIYEHALKLAGEAIQIACMAHKAKFIVPPQILSPEEIVERS